MKTLPKTSIAYSLVAASLFSASQAAVTAFSDDFTGATLDAAWSLSASNAVFDGTNDLVELSSQRVADVTTPGSFQRNTGGTLGDYTHQVTINLNTFISTGGDFKLKSFGPDGFAEIVLNSFGNVRMFHSQTGVGSGNVFNTQTDGGTLTLADADTLRFTQIYFSGSDTMSVSYSLNGAPEVSLFNDTGSGGAFNDVITNFVVSELFEFGEGAPTPVIDVTEWSLSASAIPEPSTSALLAACFGLIAFRRRR